ncbi:EF-hand domain-containing protein [Bradyrhizobium sp. SYSU BS000235]|uniref:EF-hand domain-containing protein n=1 Tax=Bradyrhizobium sp. SYSU BS000235 TaxID=3411332 RepID=UPI003C7898C4
MLFALGAAGAAASAAAGAVDFLSSLVKPKSSATKTTGSQDGSSPFSLTDLGKTSGSTQILSSSAARTSGTLSPATFNALLASQDPSKPSDALKDLFGQIDGNSDGKITKGEFEDKLGAGGTNTAAADNVFNKMDTDGDGSVTIEEMASALKGKAGGAHHAHGGGGKGGGGADALMQALQAATTTSVTNSDGSITTTMTYADGTTLTTSQAAPANNTPGNAASTYNLAEKMAQHRTDALSMAAKQSLSVRV